MHIFFCTHVHHSTKSKLKSVCNPVNRVIYKIIWVQIIHVHSFWNKCQGCKALAILSLLTTSSAEVDWFFCLFIKIWSLSLRRKFSKTSFCKIQTLWKIQVMMTSKEVSMSFLLRLLRRRKRPLRRPKALSIMTLFDENNLLNILWYGSKWPLSRYGVRSHFCIEYPPSAIIWSFSYMLALHH